jgi:hypothetical protein
MSPTRRRRRETPRNWLRNTAFRADVVVHSGGHKLQPVLCRKPYFTVFSEFPRSLDGIPSLSATDFRQRKSPSKSGISRTTGF